MKEKWLLLVLLVLKFSLPFLLSHHAFELHRDEYLYYQQGQHFDFGYLENPPLLAWLGSVSSLFGGGFFWIKFWPALFGSLTLFITVKLVKEFGGGLYAQLIAALGILFSAYLRTHFLFQPNALDIFFWTLAAYFLVRYINTKNERFFFYLAIALALGWWSKYSVLFFIAALMLSLPASPHRNVFAKKNFWLAFLCGLVLITPNLLWQWSHNFPLAHHMEELRDTQLKYLNKADFLKEQLLMLLPVCFVWMGGLVWLLRQRLYQVIAFTYLAVLALLMLGSGKAYYALGAYPMLLAGGGVWLERLTLRKRFLRYAFVGLILLLALPFVPILLPVQSPQAMAAFNKKWGLEKLGLLKWEDRQNHPLQQDFADMLGWKELAEKAERLYQSQPDSAKASTVVYGGNYGLAGGLKYYAKDDGFRRRIISENGSFLLWIPGRLYFKHLIYVDDEMPDANDDVLKRFAKAGAVDSCTNLLSRQYGAKIIFFQNASDSAWIIASQDIRKQKALFTR